MSPELSQLAISVITAVIAAAASLAGSAIVTARRFGSLEERVDGLRGQLTSLCDNGSPRCARHGAMIEEHERRLNNHDQRISALERDHFTARGDA